MTHRLTPLFNQDLPTHASSSPFIVEIAREDKRQTAALASIKGVVCTSPLLSYV
jgi:hypothetical protein